MTDDFLVDSDPDVESEIPDEPSVPAEAISEGAESAESIVPAVNSAEPSLGVTRMEAAFGSGDGDEDATAVVAQSGSIEGGTIFDQIYRPWRGNLGSRWVRNYAIYRHHVYGIISSKGHRHYHPFVRLALLAILISSMAALGFLLLASLIGDPYIMRGFGLNRVNIYTKILGFFPRNALFWPLLTALVIGGMISEDRAHGTSAIYFSRPINRIDYAAMKYLSVASILGGVILISYVSFYALAIVVEGRGWGYIFDSFPLFLSGLGIALLLIITYTSIGMALSSVSKGKFFPAVGFLSIILGTKLLAFLVDNLFDQSIVYLISPYDNLAHLGQYLMGIDLRYDHPVAFSVVSLLAINAVSLYVLSARVNSLEVTRE